MTFDQAQNEYIARIDESQFARNVGLRQELLLRTICKDDLHGAFAASVKEELNQ